MPRLEPTPSTKYKLLALSGNRCAFPECGQKIVDDDNHLVGQFCHIEATSEGGERYNPNQSDEERRHINNLILLCANHHIVTDDVAKYDVAFLQQMKISHERQYREHPYEPPKAALEELGEMIDTSVRRAMGKSNITPYTDAEFKQDMDQAQSDFNDQAKSAQARFGGSSAAKQVSIAYQKQATKKRMEFQRRKAASDRMFELGLADIEDDFAAKVKAKTVELHERGMFHSGIGQQEIGDIEARKEREIEKLKIEYGKEN
jgi:hypothetical protein